MKFMFILQTPNHFLNHERVIRYLCGKGHTVVALLDRLDKHWANLTDKPLADYAAEEPDLFSYRKLVTLQGFWRRLLYAKREIVTYIAYHRADNPLSNSPYHQGRARGLIPHFLLPLVKSKTGKTIIGARLSLALLELLEKVAPLDSAIRKELEIEKPDLIMASPYMLQKSEHIDYARVAKAMGIPLVAGMAGWDNLTTKGVLQAPPDYMFVWNNDHIEELKSIHKFPETRAFVTGSPSLDIWRNKKPSLSRVQFCEHNGLDADKPFAAYLCSSRIIAPDENKFLEQFVQSLGVGDPDASFSLLVRPHPENMKIWKDGGLSGARLRPESYSEYYSQEARDHYFDTMYHSNVIIGINTTAIIEAAILDKPCVALQTDYYSNTQINTRHYHLLLKYEFLNVAKTFEEAKATIGYLLNNEDPKNKERSHFVREFVFPQGESISASVVMGEALEELAGGGTLAEIKERAIALLAEKMNPSELTTA